MYRILEPIDHNGVHLSPDGPNATPLVPDDFFGHQTQILLDAGVIEKTEASLEGDAAEHLNDAMLLADDLADERAVPNPTDYAVVKILEIIAGIRVTETLRKMLILEQAGNPHQKDTKFPRKTVTNALERQIKLYK